MKDNNISGKFFKALRVKAKLTQSDVSEELGYKSPQYVSNVERGHCLPSPESIKKLAKMYGVNPVQIAEYIAHIRKFEMYKKAGLPVNGFVFRRA